MGIFDEMAARYDTPQREAGAKVIAMALRTHLKQTGGGKSAIDYGCGTGLVGLRLADCFQTLWLVDASPQMIAVAREKIKSAGLSNTRALCADFLAADSPQITVNIIFLAQVLLHIPDTERILRRLHDVLHPGGRLLLVDFDKNENVPTNKGVHNGFLRADLAALLVQTGYGDISSRTIYHGKRIFMNQDASLFLMDATKPLDGGKRE